VEKFTAADFKRTPPIKRQQLIIKRMIEKLNNFHDWEIFVAMYVTTVIRTSAFYPHIRTQHPQILSAFPLAATSAHPLTTHSP